MVRITSAFCFCSIGGNLLVYMAAMKKIPDDLFEAAFMDGATEGKIFFRITLPLIAPSILSGALLAFAMSMDDVVISFFATGAQTSTLPLQIYSMLKMGVTPEINALCTLMLGAVFLIVAVGRLVSARRQRRA